MAETEALHTWLRKAYDQGAFIERLTQNIRDGLLTLEDACEIVDRTYGKGLTRGSKVRP